MPNIRLHNRNGEHILTLFVEKLPQILEIHQQVFGTATGIDGAKLNTKAETTQSYICAGTEFKARRATWHDISCA